MDAATTPEAAEDASEIARRLREAQTYIVAASREGLDLQKLKLELAIEAEEWDKSERLLKLIRQGMEWPRGLTARPAPSDVKPALVAGFSLLGDRLTVSSRGGI